MAALTSADFVDFFEQIHGYRPFPWQARLAETVITDGRWPDVLALPTGSGKTSALDIALYALAVAPETHPRRIVLVVDRRVVVDQGALHAQRVLERLERANTGVLNRVASALRGTWGGEASNPPFEVAILRGGMPRDDAWARRPDRPVLAVSTVDQVGSRLLFRGYGVSDRMAPVHAGLLGHDTLFLLDEVHLSVPFAETLLAIRDRWRIFHETSLPDRWGVVRMSATPGLETTGDRTFDIDEHDRMHTTLSPRLNSHKRARLEVVTVRGAEDKRRESIANRCAKEAVDLIAAGAIVVGVVVNRVDTARLTAGLLREKDKGTVDVLLLTGRMRPLDRDRVLDEDVLARIRPRDREDCNHPLVLVATQCVEAGADFDFDGLVTELASLDALRQRFGRLDRIGALGTSPAVILARSDQLGKESEDPVYGTSLPATCAWLKQMEDELDLGIEHFPLPPESLLDSMLAPRKHAPILLPAHLDVWTQTNPRPKPEPEPGLWLHGPDSGVPEVQLLWRADIDAESLGRARADENVRAELCALLSAVPPSSLEAITLPVYAVRAWLSESEPAEIADVVAVDIPTDMVEGGRLIARWSGDDSCVLYGEEIRSGDTLVAPSSYGGIRLANWDPRAGDTVSDLGDLAQWRHRMRATLRLDERVLPFSLGSNLVGVPLIPSDNDPDASPTEEIADWLANLPDDLQEPWREIVREMGKWPRRIALPNSKWALLGRLASKRELSELSTEDDTASFIERSVTLDCHSAGVSALAGKFAAAVGLSRELCEDLQLAGRLHDVGKADPRFQRMLVGGSEVRLAILEEPLAKSAIPARDAAARELSRLRSGYPRGYRHEVLSSALLGGETEHGAPLESSSPVAKAFDRDLVLHLVESHHGRCRPFAPPIEDENPVVVEVDVDGSCLRSSTGHRLARINSGVADRYWTLVGRYGWWGLAWLEAILRLADHRASENEQQEVSR